MYTLYQSMHAIVASFGRIFLSSIHTFIPQIRWIPGYDNVEGLVNGVSTVLEAIIEIMSSPKSSGGPSITVTLDELARAIDRMGLTQSVSAGILYHSILQVQAPPSTPRPPTTLARRKAILQMSMESPKDQGLPTMSKEFVMIEPSLESVSPARRAKRRKMVELAKAAFPDGVPSPYTVLDSLSNNRLQFLCATVMMYSDDGLNAQEFKDVLCLWDSGAQISSILGGLLSPEVKGPDAHTPDEG